MSIKSETHVQPLTKDEAYKMIHLLIPLLNDPQSEREIDESKSLYFITTQEFEVWRKHPELPLEISSWGRVYRLVFIDIANCIYEGKMLKLSANQKGSVAINFKR
ncbi:hypothetical protein COA05_06000 [Bacillus thuringiensis]|uniref:hypothetical protein n=1 Tax=Bacillus thuringiensis TaxID=1428 RepID=UPI000BFCE590|nr:hypothetical protein [Bacillus thuringiensis]PGQ42032.1 hypothetical protein COA05_06000 [Bacillus thuringiensis]